MLTTTHRCPQAPQVAGVVLIDVRRPSRLVSPATMSGRPEARSHQLVAEAIKMCARGDGDATVIGRLRSRGMSEVQAASTFAAVAHQLAHKRSSARRIRGRAVVSVYLQLLVMVVLVAVNTATTPIPATLAVGSLLYRGWVRLNPRSGAHARRK